VIFLLQRDKKLTLCAKVIEALNKLDYREKRDCEQGQNHCFVNEEEAIARVDTEDYHSGKQIH
jgi:hypothetical protein